MSERPDGLQDRATVLGQRDGRQQEEYGDKPDGHEHGHAQERPPPADPTQKPAHQRPDGDAQAQRGLVEDHRLLRPRQGNLDYHGQRRGDKQGVAQPQPALKPTMPEMPSANPASALKTTIIKSPASSVRLCPTRLETTPVMSIATPVTRK